MPDRIEWIQCDCHTHAVQLWKFNDGDVLDDSIFLSLWSHGFDGDSRPDFWHRVKCAWKTLWRNDCHGHEIILNAEEAEKMAKILIEMAETCKVKNAVVDSK